MILVDTSVWIDHFANGDPTLSELLDRNQVLTHPFVIGEIALGALPRREQILGNLSALPAAELASTEEVAAFIERHALCGLGVGYVDAHLLASTHLTPGSSLWSRDRRLHRVAERLGVAA